MDSEPDESSGSADASTVSSAETVAHATVQIRKAREHTTMVVRDIEDLLMAAGISSGFTGMADAEESNLAALRTMSVVELRHLQCAAQQVVDASQAAIRSLSATQPAPSRARRLLPLQELIGLPYKRNWKDEWVQLNIEAFRLSGREQFANEYHCKTVDTPERVARKYKDTVDHQRERGWAREHAETFVTLGSAANAIGRALRARDPCYIASTFVLCEALYQSRSDLKKSLPARMYRHLSGPGSLTATEPAWDQLLAPDENGFRMVISSEMLMLDCLPMCFTNEGYSYRVAEKDHVAFHPVDSDVIVAFDSAPDDEHGCHAVVLTTSRKNGVFPPNTAFQFKEAKAPGEWEAPNGTFPRRHLLVVSATYYSPFADPAGEFTQLHADFLPKLCGGVAALGFGRPEAFAMGLNGLTCQPILTMADEFGRDHGWTASDGSQHSLRAEWEYVNGEAVPSECGVAGTRDADNKGKTVGDFQSAANQFIAERRRAGMGSIPEASALLTRDEVLALRLLTGPANHPINAFLRQAVRTAGKYQRAITQNPNLTFAATVGHACRAVRKLSDVGESSLQLWRGMRGAVPNCFWQEEVGFMPSVTRQGVVVETGFLSTSRVRQMAIEHMQQQGENVLWEIQTAPESLNGFHSGASVELISQFAHEQEVRFRHCHYLELLWRGIARPHRARPSPLRGLHGDTRCF